MAELCCLKPEDTQNNHSSISLSCGPETNPNDGDRYEIDADCTCRNHDPCRHCVGR
ncbi:SWIM zinc finger family protein [Cognatishimia sp. WU-CL00825]|uniref:SWIM zinc finger family protein n=1 Tax=Cognatishimia sp. WU-CL00825 TaxID=3127658 RepID=UPI003365509C